MLLVVHALGNAVYAACVSLFLSVQMCTFIVSPPHYICFVYVLYIFLFCFVRGMAR